MPTYVCLARWTAKGLENIKDSPSRLDAGRKLFVSFTMRRKLLRVISTREMTRRERRSYATYEKREEKA